MPERNGDITVQGLDLPMYHSHPPPWLPKVSASADLGYPGFHPPRPGQDEDMLSESNVKNGFVLTHQVSAETFSAQSMINVDLRSNVTISKLEALMNEIFVRRADSIPSVPTSTFRIPTRVTLNDSKRQAWFADLANPEVPLYKLGKSVPHGAKGHDLLDLLQTNNVAIPRAVWFLRVFGANETAGLRNKPSYNPIQYSIDWANVVTSYMKKQLADIALPSAPRPGLNIKQTFKGVLADSDTRERWISRFTYCLKLLRTFYSEGLVDSRTFLVWIVQQMWSCNLAQVGFITHLADEYLDGIVGSHALNRPFIDACLCKLSEIRATSAQEFLRDTEGLLKILLQRLCIISPDPFISPRMWRVNFPLLSDILNQVTMDHAGDSHTERRFRDICQVLQNNFIDIKRRNEAMLFQSLPVHKSARLGPVVSNIKLLNSISSTTDMTTLPFFSYPTDESTSFIEKLDMLLTWCVTPLQYGDHRPFVVVTLIRGWRDQASDRATRRGFNSPDEFLQDQLFDWLDTSDVVGDSDNIRDVALLFGKLVKHNLFSYASYIQRLIARGEEGLSFTDEGTISRHRMFLKWIPLCISMSSLTNQRKVTLYGVRARETPEDRNERKIRCEIRAALPNLFGGDLLTPTPSVSTLLESCNILMTSSRFEQVRTLRQWFLPILQKYTRCQASGDQSTLLRTYGVAVELMAHTKCFHSILDLTLSVLEHSTTVDLLIAVINTLHRFATIWACMNSVGIITSALDTAHQAWKVRGVQFRPLLTLLLEFDNGKHLSAISRERITADITAFTLALQPMTEHPEVVPDILPEILLLAGDPDEDAPSLLANSLWIKYRKSIDWAWKVWDNTIASLRQIPIMTPDTAGRRMCALRYGTFLWHVDQHLATGLDSEVLRWFLGPGKNEVAALSSDAWRVLTIVLLYLCVHGALKATTILKGLIYPVWQHAANVPMEQQGHNLETLLEFTNHLCRRLLLSEEVDEDDIPPKDLLQLQCILTRRQEAYYLPHFPLLASSIPLLICVENNENIPQVLRKSSMSLRHSLSQDRDFRQGAYRNLDAIREAFEQSLHQLDQKGGTLSKHIIAGLRMLLCDISDDVELSELPAVSGLLSPWKIAATMVQLQLILKQMGHGLLHDADNQTANTNLDRLITMLFHHSMTSEEAFYIGEMVRGVDVTVAGKFINNGLKCIAEMIQISSFMTRLEGFRRASELLRVLVYVAEPLRGESNPLPSLEPSIQDEFLEALWLSIPSTESLVTLADSLETQPRLTEEIILVLRLLQFALGFQSNWTSKTREIGSKLCSSLFNLALVYGTSHILDPTTYPLIIDTLYYICDEMPSDPKAIPYDPFRNYPDMPISELPSDLPMEYRKQLLSLLPHLPTAAAVSNLVNSYRDPTGNIVHGLPVINRPWEWIENLGEPAVLDLKEDDHERQRLKTKHLVKNSGSLSLDIFGAHSTGDGILRDLKHSPKLDGNLRAFEDGLSADNIFKRDWRETRVELEMEAIISTSVGRPRSETDNDVGSIGSYPGTLRLPDKRSTSRGSPASSVISRTSARGSTGSIRQSPGQGSSNRQSNSTISEVIDVDSVVTVSSSNRQSINKRKATAAIAASDDEIEIVEGPVPARTIADKKPRVKAPTRTRIKKK